MRNILFTLVTLLSFSITSVYGQARICPTNVPVQIADLSSNPSGTWIGPSVSRDNLCCGTTNPDRCIEFIVTLHPGAQGIKLDIASGGQPPGALFYQVNCGTPTPVGQPICLTGVGPHNVTFCKPGNNPNAYSITSIAKPSVSPPTVVSDGCTGVISAGGYIQSTITWRSVPNNPVYDAYLSSTSGQDTVTASYHLGAPAFVDYEVCGTPVGACVGVIMCDTVRVSFVSTLAANILPKNGTICFGSVGTTLTANGVGGLAPYTYLWNTGATTQSIVAGTPGNYSVIIDDATSCPIAFDTVSVTAFPSPIVVSAGTDATICNVNSPFSVQLNGFVSGASGGIWSSTGSGTFSPNNTTLFASYLPSAAELTAGKILLTLTSTGNGTCPADTDQVYYRISLGPIANPGSSISVCSNNANAQLAGNVSGNTTTGIWSTSGSGTFAPNATTLNAIYIPSSADKLAHTVTLTLTSTNNGICVPSVGSITLIITDPPYLNANTNQSVCANNPNISLNAITGVAPIQAVWTSNGTGTFSPNATTLNATYIPSPADIAGGSLQFVVTSTNNLNCNAVKDSMLVFFTPAPIVNAGANISRCKNNIGTITLNGSVSGGATTGIWSSPNGTGSFSPNATTLNATYLPSANDINNGTVTLILTSTGNTGNKCTAVKDTTILSFTPSPIVNAGTDQTDCANNISFVLSGSVTGSASSGIWSSSGTGTFSPSNTNLNATYIPSNADLISGNTIRIILTSNNGPLSNCNTASDTLFLNISPSPIVNAGTNFSVCENNALINLSGTVSAGATTGLWITTNGTGTFNPSNIVLNPIYTPSSADITLGTITFILSSTGNSGGLCNTVRDTVVVSINPKPIVNAGANITRCKNNIGTISLSGTVVAGAITGTWTSSGTGIFSNPNLLSTTYTPSIADINSLSAIQLILTSTGNSAGTCLSVSDTLLLSFTASPLVSAGSNSTVCANNIPSGIALNGSISGGASSGIWSSNGTGTFSPNNTTLNANYQPSIADISNGTVTLKLKTTNHGVTNCGADSSFRVITISPAPVVNAGSNKTICTNSASSISLNGSVSGGANTGIWTCTGTGTFTNANALSTTYNLSVADKLLSTITFTLTSTGNSGGACNAVTSTFTLNIIQPPVVNSGINQTICIPTVNLSGSVTGSAVAGIWSTPNGTGTFSNVNSLNSTYTISNNDRLNGSVMIILTSNNGPLSSCLLVKDTMMLFITPLPIVNAGNNQTLCANNAIVNLSGTVSGGASAGVWTSNGTNSIASPNSLSTTYIPSATDITNGSVQFILTSTGGNCTAVKDTMLVTFTPAPIVNAGANIVKCANNIGTINLNGTITGGANTGVWSTNGTGFFSPNNTNLSTTYIPSLTDISNGTIQIILSSTGNTGGTCNIVRDTLNITITPKPNVVAGSNETNCANNLSPIVLSGIVNGGANAGTWSTSGNGTFGNVNNLNTTYTLGSTDITNGSVILKLKSNGGPLSPCLADSSSKTIFITPAPIVNAGIDKTVCANSGAISLNGTINGGASAGIWTSTGTGTFSPNNTTLNANYLPTKADSISGTIKLILTSSGNSAGLCNAVVDTMKITILPNAFVNAGLDQPVCKIQNSIVLNGQISGSTTTGVWTTNGSGTFVPNANTKNASYVISPTDTLLTGLTFILTSNNNGNCLGDVDTMRVTFSASDDPSFTYSSGTYCVDDPSNKTPVIPILASGSSGVFSSTPAGLLLNANTGNITITGSLIGLYTVKFKTNGPCPDSSTIKINLTNSLNANFSYAGNFCKGNTNALPIFPIGSSAGFFTANSSNLKFINQNTGEIDVYNSTPGTYTITNTIPASGTCPAVSANTTITINDWVKLSTPQNLKVVCANNPVVNVQAIFNLSSPVNSGTWKTNGDGTFGNALNNSTTYVPGNNDKTNGNVSLKFVSADPAGVCNADSIIISVSITPSPIVDAGVNDTVCANNTFIQLNGSVSLGASTGIWSTNGTGFFSTSNTLLNAKYFISNQDRTNGSVKLYLTSTGNSNNTCLAVVDSVIYNLLNDPNIIAGTDQSVCFNTDTVYLNGSITGSVTTGVWTSSGTGFFVPSNTSKITKYVLSLADKNSGSIVLALNSNIATTICSFVSDTVRVSILPNSIASAGSNKTVCANNAQVSLSGSVSGITSTGTWKTNGDGTFLQATNILNNTYIPGNTDISNGIVLLRLVASNTGTCTSDSDFLQVNITPSPIVNAGTNQNICGNNPVISLSGTISAGAVKGKWTSNGTGTFSPNDSTLVLNYIPSALDISTNNLKLILTSTGNTNGTCNAVRDTVNINFLPSPSINAGVDKQICKNNIVPIVLSGQLFGSISKAKWTSINGDGTFAPHDSALNATYTLGANDIINGSVRLVLASSNHQVNACLKVSDTLQITVSPAPVVNAGIDRNVCNNIPIILNGLISGGASTGTWRTDNGTGTFSPNNTNLNGTYFPSNADYILGSIRIILESTGNTNGTCNQVADTFTVTFIPVPVVEAGVNQNVCADVIDVQLNGSVTVTTTSGIWSSSGTGVFTPNNSTLNAKYIPSLIDRTNGQVKLFLISNGGPSSCANTIDSLILNFSPAPNVDAGNNSTVCINNPIITLSGNVTGASITGTWISSGTGTFNPNNTNLTTNYIPSVNDISNGNLVFTLISTNIGTCIPDSDIVQMNFVPSPIVDAGSNQNVCANQNTVNLIGAVSQGASKGKWTSNGSGIFIPNDSTLNAIYQLSAADKLKTNFKIYLTSTGNTNGKCLAVKDSLQITLLPAVLTAMADTFRVCANNAQVILQPVLTGSANSVLWTSNGSGIFIPNNTTLNATYIPSTADTILRRVKLTLTLGNIGGCLNTTDSTLILISPSPIVNAGANITVCANNDTIFLNGTVSSGANAGVWTTNGDGVFIPNANTFNAKYKPTNADKALSQLKFILSSSGNSAGTCAIVRDTLLATINIMPVVTAGSNQTVCANNPIVNLSASITFGASAGIWSSSGTGTFSPNNTTLNAKYNITNNDILTGSVKLILTSTDHGLQNCNAVRDTLDVTISPAPMITLQDTVLSCITDNSVNVSAQITMGASTGNWISLGSGTFTPNNTDLNVNYLPSAQDKLNGFTKLVLTSTGNTGGLCLATEDTVTIIFTPLIFLNNDDTVSICKNNPAITINGNISGGSTKGKWITNGTGTFTPNDTTLNAQYIFSSADTANQNLILTLQSLENGGCDTAESKLYIDFVDAPVVDAGPNISICSNSGIASLAGYIGAGATKGKWTSTGTGTFLPNDSSLNASYIPSANDFIAGSISIRLTTTDHSLKLCLAVFDELTVNLYNSATVNAGPDRYVCYGDTSTLLFANANGANPFRYFWSTGDTTSNIMVGPGTYYIRIQDIFDCIPTFDTVVVYAVDTIIQAVAGIDSAVCIKNDSIILNGYVLGFNKGHWQGNGTFFPDSSKLNAIYYPTNTEKANGFVDLILIPSNETGCTFINDTVRFAFTEIPQTNITGPTIICDKDLPVRYEAALLPNTTYEWNIFGGSILGSNTTNVVNVLWGITGGTLSLTISSVEGCDTLIQETVTNVGMTKPQINGTLSVCNSSLFQQQYTTTNTIGSSYQWSISNGVILSGQTSNSVTVSWSGSGRLILTETGDLGCELKDTIDFTYVPLLATSITPTTIAGCAPLTVNFNSTTLNTEPLTYQWVMNNDTLNGKDVIYQFDSSGNYIVQFVINNGNCTDTLVSNVVVYVDPFASFYYTNAPFDSLSFPNDSLFIRNESEQNAYFEWDFGDGAKDTSTHPMHIYKAAGTYQILLKVTDKITGCISYTSRPFKYEVSSNLNSPNIFTPNGDGVNDKFRIYEKNLRNFKILIFNRWGEIIYTSTDPYFEWDGTHKGNNCTPGTYVFYIVAIGEDNTPFNRTGHVYLVR